MKFEFGSFVVDTEMEPWRSEGLRIAFYSAPGTRKSYTVAATIIEPTLKEGGTVVIFEPKSEWHTLKQSFGNVLVVGGPFQDVPLATNHAKVYAESVVKHGVSMVFDFTETEDEDLVRFAAEFLARLFTLENVARRPILLFFEELSEYCPFSPKGKLVPPWIYERMASRIVKIATQGRALGINMVATSQRPAQLNFTVRMMMNLSFYGKFHPKDLNEIKEVLSAYSLPESVKETAEKCVNMPHGHWLVITSEKAFYTVIDAKRITPHGADTPKIEYTAPLTGEIKTVMEQLAETIRVALEREKEQETELSKLKRQIEELTGEIRRRDDEIRELRIALRVKEAHVPEKVEKAGLDPAVVREAIFKLRNEIVGAVDRAVAHLFSEPARQSSDVVNMWLEKLPSPCAKKIFKFLADHKGVKFTKSQIALQTGYSTSSGTFNTALSLLKRNNLVKFDGNLWWFE